MQRSSDGAVERVRPKMMTVTAIMAGLVPILWSQGTGADVMKRIAAPMVGGMLTSTRAHACGHPGGVLAVEGARGGSSDAPSTEASGCADVAARDRCHSVTPRRARPRRPPSR